MPREPIDPRDPNPIPRYLPEAFSQEMFDQLAAMKEVQMAIRLLRNLVDPVTQAGACALEPAEISAMLNILDEIFASRLAAAEKLMPGN